MFCNVCKKRIPEGMYHDYSHGAVSETTRETTIVPEPEVVSQPSPGSLTKDKYAKQKRWREKNREKVRANHREYMKRRRSKGIKESGVPYLREVV